MTQSSKELLLDELQVVEHKIFAHQLERLPASRKRAYEGSGRGNNVVSFAYPIDPSRKSTQNTYKRR